MINQSIKVTNHKPTMGVGLFGGHIFIIQHVEEGDGYCDSTMARSFRREEQSEQSLDPSLFTGELLSNYDEQRSEGYDEYFDPPLESKYECPICLLGLREPVQTSCGHRFCGGCILRSIR